ncbi:MAG: TIM barrel protein [Bryobacteraceae bacterium]
MSPSLTRRQLLAALAAASAPVHAGQALARPICAFSKHFHWLSVEETASMCATLGFDGIDLTVRPGGHVEPERVEEDLPKAAETIRRVGLEVPMVTSGIVDVTTPHTERVLKTLKATGIRLYRWGGFRYDAKRAIPTQLAEMQPRVQDLAAMNRHYGVTAMYHTHSGIDQVGASMWDLYLLLKEIAPGAVAVNYDVGHAVVEGGYGGWINSTRLLLPYMRGVAVKDFAWKKNARGEWRPGWCALGKGMVDFPRFFEMLKAGDFNGPMQLHMEYDELGSAASGKKTSTLKKEQFTEIMQRDLKALKDLMRAAGLRA